MSEADLLGLWDGYPSKYRIPEPASDEHTLREEKLVVDWEESKGIGIDPVDAQAAAWREAALAVGLRPERQHVPPRTPGAIIALAEATPES